MKELVLGLVIGLVVGAALVLGFARWQHDQDVQRYEAQVREQARQDSIAAERQAASRRMLEAQRLVIDHERAVSADLQAQNAEWRRRMRPVPVVVLPDTGWVRVDSVRPVLAGLVAQVALRDSVLVVADSVHASDQRQLVAQDRAYTTLAGEHADLEIRAARWRALAESAPVRQERPRLFGLPLPEFVVALGAQVGAGYCTTPVGMQPCAYAGGGLTGGVKISL